MRKYAHSMAPLGFGCMRLPEKVSAQGKHVDEAQLEHMVDAFLDAGFTYFDTARTYHDGLGEGALRRALVNRYPRERFRLATKLPAYLLSDADMARRMFWTSLEDTQAEYFDAYLLHNLGGARTRFYDEYGVWDFVHELVEDEYIDRVGFSFHGSPEELKKILAAHPDVDFVQLQINYLDWDDHIVRSRECYETARAAGLDVIVMEPLKGGLLANPALVSNDRDADGEIDAVSCALRFCASLEGVAYVLSGMSALEQVRDNVEIMRDPRPLSDRERGTLCTIASRIRSACPIGCTGCGYCTDVCPAHIGIPHIMHAMNADALGGRSSSGTTLAHAWGMLGGASSCIRCGACENVCPQQLPIRELIAGR